MESEFFKVTNVSFSYYKRPPCLSEVSFSMKKNEKVLLLSTHEMGKTTFLEVMSSFKNNYSGEIWLDGKELKTIDDDIKNFSLLPSKPVLFENKTILKNLKYNLKEGINEEELDEKLKKYNLFDLKNKKVRKLSLFQKRLVSIIRSELKIPDILFLDDQFSNLNDDETSKMENIYSDYLNDNSKTILFVIDSKTYLKNCKFLKNYPISKVLYLLDSLVFEYQSLADFETSFDNINQLEFFDNNYKKHQAIIFNENDEYFVSINEKINLKILSDFYQKLSKLKLSNNDDEDIILVFKDNIDLENLKIENFNELLTAQKMFIFSNVDGSRIL